jgi:hypothetical protein
VQRIASDRFPYRVQIRDGSGRPLLTLRTQDRWPGANVNIFCLREPEDAAEPEAAEEVERLEIVALQRRGVRLSVVLDRRTHKRCDFLFLKRAYKQRPGETYEQIYWQSQTAMVQRRPKVAPAVLRSRHKLEIVIDNRERYPWRFAGATLMRRNLACGDYALLDGERILAVVERKTFENLLADFGVMPLLHQRLMELASHRYNALVIEAPYEDFLNPAKVHHYSAPFCAAAIADLYAAHPDLRIVFCSNRKTANLWTASFFAALRQKVTEELQRGES